MDFNDVPDRERTMMVQMVENWAWLTGRLEAVRHEADHLELDVWVESAAPVEHFPNLFQSHVGRRVLIKLRMDGPPLVAGNRVSLKARMTGNASGWADPGTLKLTGCD